MFKLMGSGPTRSLKSTDSLYQQLAVNTSVVLAKTNPVARAALAFCVFFSAGADLAVARNFIQPSPKANSLLELNLTSLSEGTIDSADSALGQDQERLEANAAQLRFVTGLNTTIKVTLDFLHETTAGNSPLLVQPASTVFGAAGDLSDPTPVVVSSLDCNRLSPQEQTHSALRLNTEFRRPGGRTIATQIGFATQDDEESVALGFEYGVDFNDAQSRFIFGLDGASRSLKPIDLERISGAGVDSCGGPQQLQDIQNTRQNDLSSTQAGFHVGLHQVLNRYTKLFAGLRLVHTSGDLSNPYLGVFIWDENALSSIVQAESRPDVRTQVSMDFGLRRFFKSAVGTAHVDYRLYADSWSMNAHTLQFSWYQNLINQWQLVPGIRYYSQSAADFYAPYSLLEITAGESASDLLSGVNLSADYRLSPFGAVTTSLELIKNFKQWKFSVLAERYSADDSLALGEVEFRNPALLDYIRVSMGLFIRW